MQRRLLAIVLLSLIGAIALACSGGEEAGTPPTTGEQEGPRTHGLTEAEASQVLAKIGDREIPVGEFP